jgi:hypothetical protein
LGLERGALAEIILAAAQASFLSDSEKLDLTWQLADEMAAVWDSL